MREKTIEQKLVKAVRNQHGLAVKLGATAWDGVPDRLLLLPGGKACFVELKAPGEKPRPLQVRRMQQLTDLGFDCYVIDSEEKIQELMHEICPA